ncbi:predicted protein, partial [Thalassiosira pseudonana CCMP1335]
LSPKNYYELHMRAMDEMPNLEEFLLGLCHAPFTTQQLYEAVQWCPRVVPRLYLQICMGSVSIRAGSSEAVQVMEELGEAAKCVQCPVRGLFLRHYLLMALKDKLPDGRLEEAETSVDDGTVEDSVEFILNNLFEMNRLWIRIQHMPGDKSKETKRRRERERNELRILVGSNLNRLSQLEGISAHTYGSKILPRVLEEVASCRDPLAQAYLMDCIIQVFPDEFHLETLEVFLGVIPRLRDKVNVRTILNNMMERLLHYYKDDLLVNDEVDTNDVKRTMAIHSFDMFEACVQRVFEARGMNIPPKDVVRLQGSLLNYTLKIAPGNIDHISRCIGQCARELETLQEQKKASMMGQGIKLLSVPLDQMALKVLELPDFSSLLAFLPWENRRKVAVSMIKAVVSGGDKTKVKEVAEEEQLFAIIAPLLRDKEMHARLGGDPVRVAQFRDEQELVAKLVNVLDHDDTDVVYQMLNVARKHINSGGAERTTVSMPPIVFSAMRLLRRGKPNDQPSPSNVDEQPAPLFLTFSKNVNCRKILVFLQKSVAILSPNNPELAFKLYLEIAVATDHLAHATLPNFQNASTEFSGIAYDFTTQAFLVYEDEISESKAQIRAITSMVGSLLSCRSFERADYEALITKTAQYAAKLLKKPDQCRMVCVCSRLFYVGGKDDPNGYRNPQRVLECLQRALKIADACSMASSSNIQLFVEILDYYVYYYEIENPAITDKFVSGLIALI